MGGEGDDIAGLFVGLFLGALLHVAIADRQLMLNLVFGAPHKLCSGIAHGQLGDLFQTLDLLPVLVFELRPKSCARLFFPGKLVVTAFQGIGSPLHVLLSAGETAVPTLQLAPLLFELSLGGPPNLQRLLFCFEEKGPFLFPGFAYDLRGALFRRLEPLA